MCSAGVCAMLAETQARFRQALGAPDASTVLPLIAGVPDSARRMEIYRRHHRESLVRHLRRRFPTIEWLIGSEAMDALARAFIASHPPSAPCMSEYGEAFIGFVGAGPGAARHRYLGAAAALDWLLGETAVAIDDTPLSIAVLAGHPPEALPDVVLCLQPGLRYLAAGWPVDELVRVRLSAEPPDQIALPATPVRFEISGARGAFAINRLGEGEFAFRRALAAAASIGAAADAALAAEPTFDPGSALAALFAARLVIAIAS